MNEKTKLIFFGSVLVLVLVFGTLLYNAYSKGTALDEPSGEEISAAPDFTVTDSEGGEVKLSDFKGKAVVLNFWASWCGYCVEEMPLFEKQFKENGQDVVFLMLNATDGRQETEEMGKALIETEGYTFPVYYDLQQSAAYAYSITGLPVTYFINKEGNIVKSVMGRISEDKLISGIKAIK